MEGWRANKLRCRWSSIIYKGIRIYCVGRLKFLIGLGFFVLIRKYFLLVSLVVMLDAGCRFCWDCCCTAALAVFLICSVISSQLNVSVVVIGATDGGDLTSLNNGQKGKLSCTVTNFVLWSLDGSASAFLLDLGVYLNKSEVLLNFGFCFVFREKTAAMGLQRRRIFCLRSLLLGLLGLLFGISSLGYLLRRSVFSA